MRPTTIPAVLSSRIGIAIACYLCTTIVCSNCVAQTLQDAKSNMTFLATFDKTMDADFAKGSKKAVTAADAARSKMLPQSNPAGAMLVDKGKFGKAISFTKKTKEVFCFNAKDNFPYSSKSFDATISFWMKTDLKKLPKGYIDPLQITDKKWNDGSIFVDFSDKSPRDFRLGVFSDIKFWNPKNRNYDSIPASERPMIDAGNVNFSAERWTHIGLVFSAINSEDKKCQTSLFIDGKKIGDLNRSQRLTWQADKAMIMLGIYYVGMIDDFAIFDVPLSNKQIAEIAKSNSSLRTLSNANDAK